MPTITKAGNSVQGSSSSMKQKVQMRGAERAGYPRSAGGGRGAERPRAPRSPAGRSARTLQKRLVQSPALSRAGTSRHLSFALVPGGSGAQCFQRAHRRSEPGSAWLTSRPPLPRGRQRLGAGSAAVLYCGERRRAGGLRRFQWGRPAHREKATYGQPWAGAGPMAPPAPAAADP